MIAAAGLFASCAGNAPTATFKSGVDTLSYAAGVANTRGLRPYLEQQMGIDSTQMKDFIRGLKTGVKASEDEKRGRRGKGGDGTAPSSTKRGDQGRECP